MSEASVDVNEVVQELRPVFIYDEETHGATRLHEVVGTTPRGDPQTQPLFLNPEFTTQRIKVMQPVGSREYEIVNLEPKDLDEVMGRLELSGVSVKDEPIFVKIILPAK